MCDNFAESAGDWGEGSAGEDGVCDGGVFEDEVMLAGPDDGQVFGFETLQKFSARLKEPDPARRGALVGA